MKKPLFILGLLFPLMANAQWTVTPDGILVDSLTGKDYMIIEREGSAEELYNSTLMNVHTLFINPKNVVSTIENQIISVTGFTETTLKYAGIRGSLKPEISVKIEFKTGRMRVTAFWVKAIWQNKVEIDPYTLFVKGGLKCFNKEGEVKNETRYNIYNLVSRNFINRIIDPSTSEEEEW